MKLYFEIFQISQDHAHGNVVIMQKNDQQEIVIPFSMPILSFQAAVKNDLLMMGGGIADDLIAESTILLTPEEIGK